MKSLFAKFKLEENTVDFMGHAVALHRDDKYLTHPAIETIERINLYVESLGKYGDSPFLYPVFGLGGLPESFSRLCAIHGGTYMLNTAVDEILMEEGKVVGVRCGTESAKAPLVICDPTYVKGMSKTNVIGQTVRAICIMDHPIPNTHDATSIQIILPQKQMNRQSGKSFPFHPPLTLFSFSDIYISMVSASHQVCANGLYIVIVSATVETKNPE